MPERGILGAVSVLEQPAVMLLPRRLTSLWSRARLFPCAVPWTCSCSILRSTASSRWLRTPSVPVSTRFISVWWATRKRSREPSCSPFGHSEGKVNGSFHSVVLNNKWQINNRRFSANYNRCSFSSWCLRAFTHQETADHVTVVTMATAMLSTNSTYLTWTAWLFLNS